MVNRLLIFFVGVCMLLFSLPALSLAVSVTAVQLDSDSSDQEVKTTEWTDYNDSDPGVIILEPVSDSIQEGDPDQPLVTGAVYNDIKEEEQSTQYRETDLNFVNRNIEESTDTDHKEEIDILSTSAADQVQSVEYIWKVEEKNRATEDDGGDDTQVSAMNKSDLIESIASKSDGGLRSTDLFMKVDDAVTIVDEAVVKKPREIVVVGSKVRGEGVPQLVAPSEDVSPASFFDVFVNIGGEDDLKLYVVATVQSDENIEEVTLSDKEVSVDYRTTIHLLGFISVKTTQRATITFGGSGADSAPDKFGRVKVSLPWWHVFGRKEVRARDLRVAIEEELESKWKVSEFDAVSGADAEAADRPSENIALYFTKVQAQAFQLLSNIMRTKHDTAKSSINNVR